MKTRIFGGTSIPNLPWQERTSDNPNSPIWRFQGNPILSRNVQANIARVFNSAPLPYEGGFIAAFRGEEIDNIPRIYIGRSQDGISWHLEKERTAFTDKEGKPFKPLYAYDPRLVKVEDMYYLIWCQDFYGAAIGMAKTKDFKVFTRLENPFLPFNRNAVLFPRKIDGLYTMLSRPSDSGHTPFGDIFISQSPDLEFWGRHRHVMSPASPWWESLKIGAGAAPIETDKGWLLFYHGVTRTCNGFVYSIGAAILDRKEPAKVLYRSSAYLLTPEEEYETVGFVPNVCFPCAALLDKDSGRIALYYGAADTNLALAFGNIDEIIDFIIAHDERDESDKESGIR